MCKSAQFLKVWLHSTTLGMRDIIRYWLGKLLSEVMNGGDLSMLLSVLKPLEFDCLNGDKTAMKLEV